MTTEYDLDFIQNQLLQKVENFLQNSTSNPKICIQLPPYLLCQINKFYLLLTKKFKNARFYFLADSTFGETDADVLAAQHVDSELLIFVTRRMEISKSKLGNIEFVFTTPETTDEAGENSDLSATTSQKSLMKRYHFIEKLQKAEIIGLLIGTFSLERYQLALQYATKLIKNNDKKVITCHMGQITPQKLANLPEIDIWVQICELKNVVFDTREYHAPICSFRELMVAFGDLDFLESEFDFSNLIPEHVNLVEKIVELEQENLAEEEEKEQESEKSSSLTVDLLKSKAVAEYNPVDNYLATRTWTGLEIGGPTEPAVLELGLDGRAAGYQNEI